MSLTLSLITALVAVLVKQWLHQYIATISDSSPRDRGRIRQSRYMGLQKWQVPMIIGLLPVLLHVSLGLFFAGFCIYLFALELVIAYAVAAMAGCVYIAYIGSLILPLVYHNCPYKTPLTVHLFRLYLAAYNRASKHIHRRHPHHSQPFRPSSMRDAEQKGVQQMEDVVDGEAISWLFSTSSNTSVKQVVLQAVLGNRNEKLDGIDRAVGDIFDQIGGLSLEMQYSVMKLKRNLFPMPPSPMSLRPFKDTTSSLIAIFQSPLRETVVFPEDVWICIFDCADWTSPSAIVLMAEVIKIWQDKLPPAAGWKSLSEVKVQWTRYLEISGGRINRHHRDMLIQVQTFLLLFWREEELGLPSNARPERPTGGGTLIEFLSRTTTELSRSLLGWLCFVTDPTLDHEPTFNFLTCLEKVLPGMIRVFCDHLSNTDGIEHHDSLLDGTSITVELMRKSQRTGEIEARRHVRTILASRTFARDLALKPRIALLIILSFHDGIPNFEPTTFLSAKHFYTNAIRCLLSPCSLEDCDTPLRLQYWELEWSLMEMVLEPLLLLHPASLSRTLPHAASYRPTYIYLSDDNGVMFRIFNEEGGLPALYTRFRAAHSQRDSDRPKALATYLALLVTYRMIDLDTFDPLHLSDSKSPNKSSFVESLSLLTRMLLYDKNSRSLTLLLQKLDHQNSVSELMWEEYITNLCQWTSDEEFWSEWSSWRRVYAVEYIRGIPDLLSVEAGRLYHLIDEGLVDGRTHVKHSAGNTSDIGEVSSYEMGDGAEKENSDGGMDVVEEYPDRAHGFIEDLPYPST